MSFPWSVWYTKAPKRVAFFVQQQGEKYLHVTTL